MSKVSVWVALAAISLSPLAAQATKDQPQPSVEAFTSSGAGHGAGFLDTYGTGFEPEEGFSTGALGGQQGWTVFVVSPGQPTVETANPSSGVQHIRIVGDTGIGVGNNIGGFTPEITVSDDMLPSRTSVDVFISELGGADYDVVAQTPTQGFITARVKFNFLGDILVLSDPGGGLVLVDTGVDWTPGQYATLRIEVDPTAPSIDYYLDDNLIFSDDQLVAGTTIEQVVLFSDNFHIDDFGDFDVLNIDVGSQPSIPITEIPTANSVGLALLALLLLGGGFLTLRRF